LKISTKICLAGTMYTLASYSSIKKNLYGFAEKLEIDFFNSGQFDFCLQ